MYTSTHLFCAGSRPDGLIERVHMIKNSRERDWYDWLVLALQATAATVAIIELIHRIG